MSTNHKEGGNKVFALTQNTSNSVSYFNSTDSNEPSATAVYNPPKYVFFLPRSEIKQV
jgi:hypothetical protein